MNNTKITQIAMAAALALQISSAAAQSSLPSYPLVACPTNNVTTLSPASVFAPAATDFNNIQATLNAKAAAGGGTVSLNSGTFRITSTVPLVIKSNVSLCAPNGAKLQLMGTTTGQLLTAGTIYNDTDANNVKIFNITFDNGLVLQRGTNVRIERNTFQNLTQFAASNTSVWGGFGVDKMINGTVLRNTFSNLSRTAFMGYNISGSTIQENTFANTFEPIHIFELDTTVITGNFANGIQRMGIEIQSDKPDPRPGVQITNNRFVNWTNSSEPNVIAMSIVAGDSTVISGNTLICGAGCPTVSKGWGMEIAGRGTTQITGNTVQGFGVGIGVGVPTETVQIVQNAIYDTDMAITKFNNGPTTQSLLIDSNQIENARTYGINAPQWDLVHAPVIQNNLIVRRPGAWAGDATRVYEAIGTSAMAAGAPAMGIYNNRILFDGPALSGFVAHGIFLAGNAGNLAGLTISNNWIGTNATTAYGNGLWLNYWGSSTNVNLTNNRFQNLANVSTGVPESEYLASGNGAINMSGSSIVPASLAVNQNVSIPALAVTPASKTGTGVLSATWSATGSNSFVPNTWFLGDGAIGLTTTNPTSTVTRIYQLSANRIARVLANHPSGALAIGKATITQN
ncbi:MAG: hypothetical protein EOP38_14255 [Rubrivivax sp.]|nr:MAG: hypothetical protein EOP38_14255 [Rubrivivax sp.]